MKEGAYVKFVGDNVDKRRGVRDIRSDHHGELKHMFSLLVVKARVQPPNPQPDFNPVLLTAYKPSHFLPSTEDLTCIKDDMEVLVSRILCNYVRAFEPLKKFVTKHIHHKYTSEMAQKSDIVVLDVLHKNENKSSDMVEIMHEMTSYLTTSYKLTALSGGDHLTCEREQSAKRHVMCSNTREGRLEQLEPCCEDWHCLMSFLMVRTKHHVQQCTQLYLHVQGMN